MSGHTDIYRSYWWWEDKDDWLKVTVIAAPVFVVLGAVLISYRLYARRRTSYIYTPPVPADAVYKPTTHRIDKTHYAINEHAVDVGPHTPSVITEQEPMLKPTREDQTDTHPV